MVWIVVGGRWRQTSDQLGRCGCVEEEWLRSVRYSGRSDDDAMIFDHAVKRRPRTILFKSEHRAIFGRSICVRKMTSGDTEDRPMANLVRSAKSGGDWTLNDLESYHISLNQVDPFLFFGLHVGDIARALGMTLSTFPVTGVATAPS